MDWTNVTEVLALPIAQDWGKLFRARVAGATGARIQLEASRATLEALTRKLRTRHWTTRHTSKSRVDRRADSRYCRSPLKPQFVIRLSNHSYPRGGNFTGAKDYVLTTDIMAEFNVLGLIRQIEADERAFDVHQFRHERRLSRRKPA